MKIKLTPAQKEVIRKMREGLVVEFYYTNETPINRKAILRKALSDNTNTIPIRIINKLYDDCKLIQSKMIRPNVLKYTLTELGKTIEL